MDEARLVRFVEGPGGEITPDLGRRLPGRGLWVAADRASITTAMKKGLFARAAKRRLTAPTDLAEWVEHILLLRLRDGLGLARKAGALTCGFEKVAQAVARGDARWLVEATDGADDGRRKLIGAARRASGTVRVIGLFSSAELDLALGMENVVHTALLAGRSTERWAVDVERLAGFRPVFPESWLDGP
jgi:predicted RNA-binding protein YlxR (DUF448 family)